MSKGVEENTGGFDYQMNPAIAYTTFARWRSEFPVRSFKRRYFVSECKVRSERSDSERPSEAASPPLMRQYLERQHGERECSKRSSVPVG